jgi:HEAT repeat protein
LAIYGSTAAVPELAKLLPDPQLSSWARIALEAIPGPEADEALRQAAGSLKGKLLIGTINSIGVRRDAKAVAPLTARVQDKNAEVASAAAVALGRIGNPAATKALRAALAAAPAEVRSAVAEGCVLCAERLHAEGKSVEAAEIYDEVRKSDVPKQRIIEATRGAILARNQQSVPLLLETLRSPDKGLFQLALSTAREFPGGEVDKALAAELGEAKPERAALIIVAMADRPETVDLSAILNAAGNGPKPVRLAAVAALGRVGDASCLSTLLEAALDADRRLSQAAKESLAGLAGEEVDAQIVALLSEAEGKSYPLLIELVGMRRIDAEPDLLKALNHSDQEVRSAALTALGETVALERLNVLVSRVVAPRYPQDVPVAQQALRVASMRMPDREACAAEIAKALPHSPAEAKSILLEILGDVGGTRALQTLAAAAKSDDPELQDASSRVLGKWNGLDAAPVLLDLAKSAPQAKYQIRALRGYIGLARKFTMPEPQRVQMCRTALDAARQTAEQKLVLDVLEIHPSIEGLKLAVQAMQVSELKQDATRAMLVIGQKVRGKGDEVSQLLSKAGFEKVKLEIIKAEYGADSTFKDVTAVLKKYAGDLPLISLPASSYNANFGGDPSPGSVKQLKIQYRLNGKAGKASFAENELIILPMPK